MVHDAIQTVTRLHRGCGGIAAAAAVICVVLLCAGCGSSIEGSTLAAHHHTSASNERSPAGSPIEHSAVDVGESARSDTCAQWRAGTVEERHGALIRLRKFAGSAVGSSEYLQYGHVLGDARAYKILQNVCSKHFARAFKLYKLYERAAAFIGH